MRVRGSVKTSVILSTCFLMLITISALSFGAEIKFGKVSLAQVRRNSAKVKVALEQLGKAQTAAVMKVNSLKKDLKKLQENLKSGKDSLSQEEKTKLKADLEDKKQSLQVEETSGQDQVDFPTEVDPECSQNANGSGDRKNCKARRRFGHILE